MHFPLLFNCHVPVELIGSRALGSLIIWYEAMHHGIYEIPPFGVGGGGKGTKDPRIYRSDSENST